MTLMQDYYSAKDLAQKPPAWKEGFEAYIEDPLKFKNPYPTNPESYKEYEQGWLDAKFYTAVEGGYYDWL